MSMAQAVKPEATVTITATGTNNLANGVGLVLVNPASLLAALTINLPANPMDRDVVIMQFGGAVTSGTVVTLLTIGAQGTAAILGTLPTTATANNCIAYMYNVNTNKWYRFI